MNASNPEHHPVPIDEVIEALKSAAIAIEEEADEYRSNPRLPYDRHIRERVARTLSSHASYLIRLKDRIRKDGIQP